ncbi:MAG: glutathione S-transferase [Paracoccaceae bacterium]
MKLLYSPLSPYVRKVMVVAHELGLADQIETEAQGGTPIDPNPVIVGANPVGKIPTLITADHGNLFDSRVICRYLNSVGGGALYGQGDAEWPIIGREALAEGMIDAALLAAYEARLRPEDIRFPPWVEGQRAKVTQGAQAFEVRIGEMSGDLTIDKIALGCALGYADFRHADLGWRDSCPQLAAWYETFVARPSMQATLPAT